MIEHKHEVLIITTSPQKLLNPSVKEIEGAKVYTFYPLNIYERSESNKKPVLIKPLWHGIDLLWNPHSYRVIRHILQKERPDVVHIHTFKGLSPSVFSAVRSLNLPLVFTAHEYSLICPRVGLITRSGGVCANPPILCRVYKIIKNSTIDNKPDIVITHSQFVIDKLREQGLFRNTKTVVLPPPIELYNEGIKKDYETIDILYVGQIGKFKGVHTLITAFKQLKHNNTRLHIVGEGRDVEEFKRMAIDDSRVIFHGFVSGEGLAELYKKANITVVPSIFYEPLGLVIIESFTYGTPVVASNIGGIPELIETGYNGFLFQAGDVAELKEILGSLLDNPSQLEKLSAGALESATKYDAGQYIKKLEGVYESALARKQ